MFFSYLNEYAVEGRDAHQIQWGAETSKLTPSGALAAAFAEGLTSFDSDSAVATMGRSSSEDPSSAAPAPPVSNQNSALKEK